MRTEALISEISTEFPKFRIVSKVTNRFSRTIDLALKCLTLGAQNRYLTEYHTVIGNTLYVAPTWETMNDEERVILLRHERVHLRQRRRFGLPLMAFLYLVPFFPLGLAYGRARMEWEAYEETLRATAELRGLDAARDPALREKIIERFTGADYGWMWPFAGVVGRWYDRTLKQLTNASAEGQ